jgi:hypothetical protein
VHLIQRPQTDFHSDRLNPGERVPTTSRPAAAGPDDPGFADGTPAARVGWRRPALPAAGEQLRRIAARLHRRPTVMPPHHELLAALRQTGCPICHLLDGFERTFFFCFYNETYAQLEVLHELTGSLGFCPTHAVVALQGGADHSPFAMSHGVVVRRLRREWQSDRRRAWEANLAARSGEPSRCPACRSRDAQSGRSSFFLG